MREQLVFDQSRDVLIAIDLSRSMLASDVSPTRLDRAKIMIQGLLQELKGERIGLLLFAGTAYLQSPLSPDIEIVSEMIPQLTPDWMPQGGTDYQQMLRVAVDAFESGQSADRFLIILSDGESTTDGWETYAEKLSKQNVKVISLGIGTETGSVIPDRSGGYTKDSRGAVVMSKLEPQTLQAVAEKTKGLYRDAVNWIDLHQLVEATVNQGVEGEFREKKQEKKVERFQWFLGIAWICFLISFFVEMPVRLRPRRMQVSLLVLGLFLSSLFSLAQPVNLPKEQTTSLSELGNEVARLSSLASIPVKEWATLAEKTLAEGQKNPQFPEGIVRDAIQGVDRGNQQAPEAADWKRLRDELEKMLQKKNQQQKQNQNQDSNQNQDKNNDPSKSDPQKQNNQQNSSSQNNSAQNPQDSQKQNSQNNSNGSPQDSSQNQNSSSENKPSENSKNESASPDSQKESKESGAKPESQKSSKDASSSTQKVGGQNREENRAQSQDFSKAQKIQLNQVKEGDAPGKLFQILEGNQKSKTETNKDW